MTEAIDNPFEDPTTKQAATTVADAIDNPFEASPAAPTTPGEITNDVGNTVIVPKPGEDFMDTINRVHAYGKKVTQQQLDAETATMPEKAKTVLEAAPLAGFAGAGALAGAAELPALTSSAMGAVKAMAKAHPLAAGLIKKALEGAAFGVGAESGIKHIKDILKLL